MARWIIVLAVMAAGCAHRQTIPSPSYKTASIAAHKCVMNAAAQYSERDATPYQVADAAMAYCDLELTRLKAALRSDFSTLRIPPERMAYEVESQTAESRERLRGYAVEAVVQRR